MMTMMIGSTTMMTTMMTISCRLFLEDVGPQAVLPEAQVELVQLGVLNVDHRLAHLADQEGQVQAVARQVLAQLEVQHVGLVALDLPEALQEVLLAAQAQALPVAQTQEVRQEEALLQAALHEARRLQQSANLWEVTQRLVQR